MRSSNEQWPSPTQDAARPAESIERQAAKDDTDLIHRIPNVGYQPASVARRLLAIQRNAAILKQDDLLLIPLDRVLPDFEISLEDRLSLLRLGKVRCGKLPHSQMYYASDDDLHYLASTLQFDRYTCRRSLDPRVVRYDLDNQVVRHFVDSERRYKL